MGAVLRRNLDKARAAPGTQDPQQQARCAAQRLLPFPAWAKRGARQFRHYVTVTLREEDQ